MLTDYNESARLFTDEEDTKMINLKYLNGKKPKEIAEILGYTDIQISSRISLLVSKDGYAKELHLANLKNKERFRELRREKIINMYKAGMTKKDISKFLKTSIHTVRNELIRWKYESGL